MTFNLKSALNATWQFQLHSLDNRRSIHPSAPLVSLGSVALLKPSTLHYHPHADFTFSFGKKTHAIRRQCLNTVPPCGSPVYTYFVILSVARAGPALTLSSFVHEIPPFVPYWYALFLRLSPLRHSHIFPFYWITLITGKHSIISPILNKIKQNELPILHPYPAISPFLCREPSPNLLADGCFFGISDFMRLKLNSWSASWALSFYGKCHHCLLISWIKNLNKVSLTLHTESIRKA